MQDWALNKQLHFLGEATGSESQKLACGPAAQSPVVEARLESDPISLRLHLCAICPTPSLNWVLGA